jgi:hypothetical protein
MLGALDLRHQQRDALRWRGDERRQRLARFGKFGRVDRGARNCQRALDVARHLR